VLRSPLLHFLLLGGMLFALQSAWSMRPERPVIEVRRSEIAAGLSAYRSQMGRPPSENEAEAIERQAIDNAIWLQQAFDLRLHEIDSVVRQRLLLNMRFLEGESEQSDDALIARAIELGMDRSDTVVQRRLIDRVQAIVRAGVRARPVDEVALEAHYAETIDRWREPPLVDLVHVYLSRDRRGESTVADAAQLLSRLEAEAPAIEDAIALGDPFLAGHRLRGATPHRVVARLGPVFSDGIANAPVGRWFGPVESAFGQHLVWIEDRVPARVPPLSEIRDRVIEDWIEAESRKALREHVEARRLEVDLRIVEDVPSDAPVSG
jgi:hypothetical protein